MKTLLIRLFIDNWFRKLISLILAMVIWIVVNRSMTATKVIPNIPIRVANLPDQKTIEGMQSNGTLGTKISLTVVGNKSALDELSSGDLEVVIDASDKNKEWIASISEKNLVSLNPDFDVSKMVSRVVPLEMIVRQSELVREKIPVLVTQPIGEAPKGYQFLDIWPYQLSMTVEGPEEVVKRLKSRGLKLTLNLNDISAKDLDILQLKNGVNNSDEISFLVPESWKKISLPQLSDTPIAINDPQVKDLRIDFARQDLLPIGFSIPVSLFFPPKHSQMINPETHSLENNEFVASSNGIQVLNTPLYAQGVSRLFLETVKDMVQMVIIANPQQEESSLLWNVQFIYPHDLEDRYVAKVMSQSSGETFHVHPHQLEDYLRNRFRSYMNRFRLYTSDKKKLNLNIKIKDNSISVTPQKISP